MTATDAEVWALVEGLGSQSAAARALATEQSTVRYKLLRHARSIGVPASDIPGSKVTDGGTPVREQKRKARAAA